MGWPEIHEQVNCEFACDCNSTVIAYRLHSNNSQHYGHWCRRCGKFTVVPKSALDHKAIQSAVPLDQSIAQQRSEARSKRIQELCDQWKQRETQDWWSSYNAYLESDKWKNKRKRVLERDDNMCQACLKRAATQVHHLTYRHVFNEPLFDLISVCDLCHEAITNLDREEVAK